MAFSKTTKRIAAGCAITVGALWLYDNQKAPSPFGPELAKQTDSALHRHGEGFSTLNLGSERLSQPATETVIDAAVRKIEADLGGESPRNAALGYCSLALQNNLFSGEDGPIRKQVLEAAKSFSFADPNSSLPPKLSDDCRTIDIQLLPDAGAIYRATPEK